MTLIMSGIWKMLSTLSSKWWRLSPVILSTPWSYLCIFKHLWQSRVSPSTTAVYHLSIMLHILLNPISAQFSWIRGNCIFSSLIALLKVWAIIGSYPRSLYLCNRWSDRQCEPGGISCSLPKDQIIYSSSASSSTRTRALNIDLSKSVELRKCFEHLFVSPASWTWYSGNILLIHGGICW